MFISEKSTEVQQQVRIALSAMKRLKHLDTAVFLAGGAVRNWYFNKPANDLDFYIEANHTTGLKEHVSLLLGSEFTQMGSALARGLYGSNPKLVSVVEGFYQGTRVQVMSVEQRQSVTKTFPFGICRCGMDRRGRFFFDKEFYQELTNKSLVKRSPLYMEKDKYVNKIKSYFPDWKYFESEGEFANYLIDIIFEKETNV